MAGSETLFGEALSDAFMGKQKGDFLVCVDEDDKQWSDHPFELSFYFSEPEEVERRVLSLVCEEGCRIVDIGCGSGRVLKYLQEQGFNALGLDIDRVAVDVALRRKCQSVYVGSLETSEDFGLFDVILLMNRTLCSMGTLDQIESVLVRCWAFACSGGRLVFDSHEVRGNLAHPSPGIMQDILRFKYNGKVGVPFIRTFFSSAIGRKLVERAGWHIIFTLWDDDRYWMVCEK
jgi:SAM-dependent methyltransferase